MNQEITLIPKEIFIQDHENILKAYYKLPKLEKNIFDKMLSKMEISDDPFCNYKVSFKEVNDITDETINFKQFHDSATNIIEKVLEIYTEYGSLLQVGLASHVKHENNNDYIEIGMSPKVRRYHLTLKEVLREEI